jgi:CelD/BcsL family acetyltransferase involved in cellulose biosynthesis
MSGGRVRALALPGGEGLEQHAEAWRRLAAAALEPNPFYEPALLLPALRWLRGDAQVEVVLVFQEEAAGGPPLLIGLYPFQRVARYRGLPLACLQLWKHIHCFLCTPLVDAAHARESLAGLFDWLRASSGAPLVELGFCAGDGAWARALDEFLAATGRRRALADTLSRAVYRPAADFDSYLETAFPRAKRKEFRRLERRLGEAGRLEYSELQPGEDPQPWIDAFLELEAAGWKGRDGTALGVDPAQRRYFQEGAAALAAEGRLGMLGLSLDGRWVALKCNFLAGRGGFAYKIAYDEKHARFSPGVLLEIETISRLHRRPEIEWMDSCAVQDHFMANRLWTSRREISTNLIGSGAASGRFLVRALPWLQRGRQLLKRLRGRVSPPAADSAASGVDEMAGGATHSRS